MKVGLWISASAALGIGASGTIAILHRMAPLEPAGERKVEVRFGPGLAPLRPEILAYKNSSYERLLREVRRDGRAVLTGVIADYPTPVREGETLYLVAGGLRKNLVFFDSLASWKDGFLAEMYLEDLDSTIQVLARMEEAGGRTVVTFDVDLPPLPGVVYPPSADAPNGFVIQALNPVGGYVFRPEGWGYLEAHRPRRSGQGRSFTWWIAGGEGSADPGGPAIKIDLVLSSLGSEEVTFAGERVTFSPRAMVDASTRAIKESADEVLYESEPELFKTYERVFLEVSIAGRRRLIVSLWGKEGNIVARCIAEADLAEWADYSELFHVLVRSYYPLDPRIIVAMTGPPPAPYVSKEK